MLTFQDLPNTSTPINANNLNGNFNEIPNLIKYEDKTITITNVSPGTNRYGTASFTIPSGYKLLALTIMNKHWVAQAISSIINYNNSSVAVNVNTVSSLSSIDIIVRIIYIKDYS